MKKVITYGTFDLLHYGHINLLRRAKELGDYLIVALSTDEFNWNEKQKKCYFTYEQRKKLLEAIRYVDKVVMQNDMDKLRPVKEYGIDAVFVGSDWKGTEAWQQYEKEFASVGCSVVYLDHTDGISSSILRERLNQE